MILHSFFMRQIVAVRWRRFHLGFVFVLCSSQTHGWCVEWPVKIGKCYVQRGFTENRCDSKGCSSRSQCEGQGFDPPHLHQ